MWEGDRTRWPPLSLDARRPLLSLDTRRPPLSLDARWPHDRNPDYGWGQEEGGEGGARQGRYAATTPPTPTPALERPGLQPARRG